MELMLQGPEYLSLAAFTRLVLRPEYLLYYVMSVFHEVELILLIVECLRTDILPIVVLSGSVGLLNIFVSFVSWVPDLEYKVFEG
jgi:hypothetical protein